MSPVHSRSAIGRRRLLGACGFSLTLPMLETFTPRKASGAEPTQAIPPRMLVAHFGTGMNLNEFFPEDEGKDASLKRITAPLDRHRKRMTILSGFQLAHGGGHTGDYSFLTGTKGWANGVIEGGVSADQVVAAEVGSRTRYPSMQLSIERGTNFGNQGLATLSWSSSGIPMAAENDPHVLFRRLFGTDDADESSQRDAAFRRRGSLLDLVQEQARDMNREVNRADRRKLDEYFTSVREIERQLQRDIDWSKKPKPHPQLNGIGDYSRSLTPDAKNFDYRRYQKLMYDLIVLAFKTDSTRVITYNVRQELRGGTFDVHGVSKGFHALTHHNNDPKNLDELARVDEINMGFWADFLDRMGEVEQVDGSSLLDHSVLAFSSSAGMDHSRDRLPTAIFGGGALGLKHKTHVKLTDKTPLSNLWRTMAGAMGVHRDSLQDSTGLVDAIL
ncbi:MAG: DUF1552 domain-containing protein [Planctomycetota bacterium]